MSGLSSVLLKLVGAGLLCGGILSLSVRGAGREILRFGSACLMVVLLLTLFRGGTISLPDTELSDAHIRQQVEQAQTQVRQQIVSQTERDLALQVEQLAQGLSLDCKAEVRCNCDSTGTVTIKQVLIRYSCGPQEELNTLTAETASLLAVSRQNIIIQEVGP